MVAVGLFVALEAKPGKEEALASFLQSAVPLVQQEPQTTAWFARPAQALPVPRPPLARRPRRRSDRDRLGRSAPPRRSGV